MFTEFAQYWSGSVVWSADLLWSSLWDQRTFLILVILWVALVFKDWNRIGWTSAGWKFLERGILAVKALIWPAIVLAIIFAFLVLLVAPAQKYRELETSYQHLSGENKTLETANKELKTANTSLASDKQQLEKSLNDLHSQVEITQSDKEKRAVAIAEKCFYKPLEFTQAPIRVPPPKDMASLLYANRIKLRMHLVPSETGRIKVYADANFNGFAEPIDVIKVGPTEGTDAEYEIHPRISQRTSITFTIYSANPFNVECIDKLPLL
jgi:hypothetical protein